MLAIKQIIDEIQDEISNMSLTNMNIFEYENMLKNNLRTYFDIAMLENVNMRSNICETHNPFEIPVIRKKIWNIKFSKRQARLTIVSVKCYS